MSAWAKFLSYNVLRRLRDAVRRKRPEKWKYRVWFLFYYNAAAHRSVLVKDYLKKSNVTALELPPHSPDLVTAHFYLSLRLKSALKGRSFCDSTDFINNAREDLKRVSHNGFQESFQHFYCRWQNFSFAQRGLFWRKCSFNYSTVLFSSEIKRMRKLFEAPSISSQYCTRLLGEFNISERGACLDERKALQWQIISEICLS
jgi:transposase